jgi:hypothetical protein
MAHGSILMRFIFWTCMNATQPNIFKVRLKIDGVDTNSDSLFNGDTKLLLLIGSILIRYTKSRACAVSRMCRFLLSAIPILLWCSYTRRLVNYSFFREILLDILVYKFASIITYEVLDIFFQIIF